MEPATAVGFAASIVTFIDFSHKLITGTLQVINAGSTTENEHWGKVTKELQNVTTALEVDFLEQSEHVTALKSLAADCKKLSEKLQKAPEVDRPARSQNVHGFQEGRRQGGPSLRECRSEILTRLSLILNERQLSTSVQIASLGEHIDVIRSNVDDLKRLQESLSAFAKEILGGASALGDKVQKHVDELCAKVQQLLDATRPPTPETRVLRQLYFEEMFAREDEISTAADGTFRWILDDTNVTGYDSDDKISDSSQYIAVDVHARYLQNKARALQAEARESLLRWLAEENGIFHILGKAGSGKSTLMKLIAGHARTQEQLKRWAGHKHLIFAPFFAWRTGAKKQHSLDGLYRFMLFAVLVRRMDLIPLVFPDATMAFSVTPCEPYIDQNHFRPLKLDAALRRLASLSSAKGIRICFLIDGLDEFENDITQRHSYADLCEKLRLWAQGSDVKFLVSSRPETDFKTLAPERLQVHLHHLTEPDIGRMALNMFKKHDTFQHVKPYYRSLVDEIVIKAEGVFMWVLLMTRELCNLAAAGEDERTLRNLLDRNPGLDTLYNELIESINPIHRDTVYQMLLWAIIARRRGTRCSTFSMSWIGQLFDDPDFPMPSTIDLSNQESERRLRLGDYRVSLTKGLLETSGNDFPKVDFIHRTAYDFLQQSLQVRQIRSKYPNLNEHFLMAKDQLAHLSFLNSTIPRDSSLIGLAANLNDLEAWNNSTKERYQCLDAMERITPYLQGWWYLILLNRTLLNTTENLIANAKPSPCHHLLWVAFEIRGSTEYLQRRLEDTPEAIHSNDGERSLSLAAILSQSPCVATVQYLLEKGASPNEEAVCFHSPLYYELSKDPEFSWGSKESVWTIFCLFFAGQIIYSSEFEAMEDFHRKKYGPILELFLKTGAVDPNAYFKLRAGDIDYPTHVVSLKDLVKQLFHENPTFWEELFSKCQKGTSSSVQQRWLSRREGLLPYRLGMRPSVSSSFGGVKTRFYLQSVVVEGREFRPRDTWVRII
ncbi:hypothetical protein VTJ83DRAFT_6538 [Remersonia thermophila]|uniref:Nephrocystin 3-like N-terminal domain-containing protein n=1 Tax=Remersonia thermophila TaxID=72144 RepID=A0ABR4D517_9PEZI